MTTTTTPHPAVVALPPKAVGATPRVMGWGVFVGPLKSAPTAPRSPSFGAGCSAFPPRLCMNYHRLTCSVVLSAYRR